MKKKSAAALQFLIGFCGKCNTIYIIFILQTDLIEGESAASNKKIGKHFSSLTPTFVISLCFVNNEKRTFQTENGNIGTEASMQHTA